MVILKQIIDLIEQQEKFRNLNLQNCISLILILLIVFDKLFELKNIDLKFLKWLSYYLNKIKGLIKKKKHKDSFKIDSKNVDF